jgi:hypothetical protein
MLASLFLSSDVTIPATAVAGINKTDNSVCFLALSGASNAIKIGGASSFHASDCSIVSNGGIQLASAPSLTGTKLEANQGCTPSSTCGDVTDSNYHVPPAYNPLKELDSAASGLPTASRGNPQVKCNGGGNASNIEGGGKGYTIAHALRSAAVFFAQSVVTPANAASGSDGGNLCTRSVSPGTYGGLTVQNNDTITLSTGVYIFDDITITGGALTACSACVVNIIVNNDISITGGTITLTANTGSTYPMLDGVLIYDRNPSEHTDKFQGSSNSVFGGAIYLPNADAKWNGNAASTLLDCTEVIAYSLISEVGVRPP